MKMAEAAIEWVPNRPDGFGVKDAPPGSVRVARQEPGWSRWRAMWLPIGRPLKLKATEAEKALKMFLDFHAMVVRDGIDPHALHAEMLKVDEYRKHIAQDIHGAR